MMKNIRLPGFHKPSFVRDEKGFTLIEVLVVIPLIVILAGGLLFAIGTSTKIYTILSEDETAKDIAISNMEFIFSQPYQNSYQSAPQPPYVCTAVVTPFPIHNNEQRIDLTVSLNNKTIFTLTDYRVNY